MDTGQGVVTDMEPQGRLILVKVVPGMERLTWAQGQDGFCSWTVTRLETNAVNAGVLLVEGMSRKCLKVGEVLVAGQFQFY
jgi:hypothetical protein